jgi:hypothetical protein
MPRLERSDDVGHMQAAAEQAVEPDPQRPPHPGRALASARQHLLKFSIGMHDFAQELLAGRG